MTKDLIATFGKSDGGTHNWKYRDLDPNLTAPQIKEACELLTNLDICTQNGVKLFDSVVTAKVLTYKETLIFDPEHETRGVRYDGEPVEETTCEEVRCFEVAEKQEKPTTVATSKSSVLPATPRGRLSKNRPVKKFVALRSRKKRSLCRLRNPPCSQQHHMVATLNN
ncbi:hypothetical protein TTRE_0000960601 [Trichuris trichiura]|uniref:Uncharacterized protein n=1 Tax=Trichuris trichiura TaxID=36087 RepID=A0A077ZQU7_TRITR|nr:hypothetical protein TTRE_0000960601 [Trichuris trichiura]